ncbi:hypothetical protein EV356DRAFT_290640 [Viridothelium virens]|uniref:Zn(2)-C6 fungal-type domain-containing protein n=1 Tax=Viridothelium virens TaxID=1048519 RepID=A0A6A6H1L0_VIRVR|nr:hypothetical protein EV356DRAFT_290640 [Viridothelium virens]
MLAMAEHSGATTNPILHHQHPHQPQPQQRPPYPEPHSYPSPSLQNSYAYPPQDQQPVQTSDYRTPSTSSMSQHAVNLPPIRSFDGQNQPSAQQPSVAYPAPSPLPQPGPPMNSYYQPSYLSAPPGPQPSTLAQTAAQMGMRYPMPPHLDQRTMSGGRHKKEIKRRTKTGCLTCRKRRIKCDEAHPTCRNCQKSKRECLGYDPIFKQQPGPPALQPAPSAAPSAPSEATTAGTASASYSSIPQGYVPASSVSYVPGFPSTSSPNPSSDSAYDYGAAIDPALATGEGAANMAGNQMNQGNSDTYRSATEIPHPSKAHRLPIEDLFALHNIAPTQPPPRTEPLPTDLLDEVKNMYEREYAPGLDRLLETTWYTTTGAIRLTHYTRLCEEVDFVLSEMRRVQSDDHDGQRRLESAEAKLIWDLACMCRLSPPPGFSPTPRDPEDQAKLAEVQLRLGIVEGLLCSTNPTGRTSSTTTTNGAVVDFRKPTAQPEPKTNQIVYFSREFWRCLGLFVSLPPDDPAPATLRAAEQTLGTLRGILQMLENRDVLYSVAVARHFGSRLPEFPDQGPQAWNNDDGDVRTKVAIAKRFCEDEAGGKGTTQVVQRVCGMAVRSWTLWKKEQNSVS